MAAPTIINGSEHMFSTIYEGTGTGQRVGKFVPFTNNGTIAKSCIFASGDSPVLSHTLGGDGNKKKFTISAWVKPCKFTGDYQSILVGGGTGNGTASAGLYFNANMQIYIYFFGADTLITNRTFVDTSKFYHIVVRVDSSDSTADDRVRLYVDGTQITSFATRNNPSQEAEDTLFNVGSNIFNIGKHTSGNAYYYLDNVLAEVNFADGQSYGPETFGITDTSTGRWIPKSLTGITYGTNGFRCEFANSAGQTVGDDTSGQGNDFTVTNLAATDINTDTPTQNFMTFGNGERFLGTQQTTEQGGMTIYAASGAGYTAMAANKEIPQSGKWYWEVKLDAVGNVNGISNPGYGVIDRNIKDGINLFATGSEFVNQTGGMGATFWSGFRFTGLFGTSTELTIGSYTAAEDDYVVFAFDMDDGKAWWGFKDGSADLVFYANDGGTDGNPSTGANPTITFNPKDHRFVPVQGFYAPGSGYSARYHYNFGQKAYAFTAPTGFSGLSQNNFPETGKDIPDLVWIKNRDAGDNHQMYDSSRGVQQVLTTEAGAESTVSDGLQKFLKGGCAIEDDVSINTVAESYVSWNWVANGGTTAANTDGSGASIASTTQANDTAGFSIVTYTGTGSAGTIAHGLSSAPEWVMASRRTDSSGDGWSTYHSGMTDANYYIDTRHTNAQASASVVWNGTAPTNKVFSVGTASGTNTSSKTYVAYCWHPVAGYSKFGSYFGNGSSDGPFIYTGFKPSWLMIKRIDSSTGGNWSIIDNTRYIANPIGPPILADDSGAESGLSSITMDLLSNGFKIRNTLNSNNNSSGTYIYMAFAEHPFVGNGTNPVTAR